MVSAKSVKLCIYSKYHQAKKVLGWIGIGNPLAWIGGLITGFSLTVGDWGSLPMWSKSTSTKNMISFSFSPLLHVLEHGHNQPLNQSLAASQSCYSCGLDYQRVSFCCSARRMKQTFELKLGNFLELLCSLPYC